MIELTPLDVRKKKGDFRRILRGYDPAEVDSFLGLVEARFETLVMDNLSLTDKAQRLASQLEALEGREKAVQEALVTAQKLREDVQDQSAREAESLRAQAQMEADALKDQALREAESTRGEAHREASILRDEAIREAAAVRDEARRESELLRREALTEVESRLLEAEGLIKERQRALEELERSRLKFLKGFRTLLEREMDSVEVEEARRPLDETPLELTFKSWSGPEEEEKRPSESSELEVVEEESAVLESYEQVIDLDAPMAGTSEEEGSTEGWGALPGDEPPEGEFSDIVPVGVFEAAGPSSVETVDEPAEVEEGSDAEEGEPPRGSQPRWLFSLLKDAEESGGEENKEEGGEPDLDASETPSAEVEWVREDPDEVEPRLD